MAYTQISPQINLQTNTKINNICKINKNMELDKKISEILPKYKNNTSDNIINLAISGGGVKGLAIIGALKMLKEKGLLDNIQEIACTSAGAIVATMYCLGYTFDGLFNFFNMLDVASVVSIDPTKFIDCYAFDDGLRTEFVLAKMIEAKNVSKEITLSELYEKSKITLHITGSCINDSQAYYFSHINNPNMPVLTCLKITSAIPIVYKPVIYEGKTYVDGSCTDNYPIHLFKDNINKTIGIYVKDAVKFKKEINNLEEYLFSLIGCLTEGVSSNLVDGYEKQSIIINLPSAQIVGQKISTKLKKELFVTGYSEAKKFIDTYTTKYTIK